METVKDCHYPWTWMMVTADGNVRPCCFASGSLGNLNSASAEDIWNGSVAVELRKFIVKNKVHKICVNAPCKFVQNMKLAEHG
jgi:radical SAM protein with 4Fe4S-binding SPASM domain